MYNVAHRQTFMGLANHCPKLLWVLLIIVFRAMVKDIKNSMFALVSTTF